MDNQTLMYIVVGVLVLFFTFLTVFNVKTWRWLHVFCALMVFFSAGTFVFFTAAVLRTHEAWATVANKLGAEVAEQERTVAELKRGKMIDAEGRLATIQDEVAAAEDSIEGIRAALQRTIMDRGRVYRGSRPQLAGGDSILVTLVEAPAAPEPPIDDAPAEGEAPPADGDPAPPAEGEAPADPDVPAEPAPPAAPASGHTIKANTIVHAFREGETVLESEVGDFLVPKFYLGEFIVTAADQTTITIRPAIPSNPRQQAEIEAGGSWAIYTKMPVDIHYAFEDLNEEEIRNLFPKTAMSIPDDEYQIRIERMARYFDGQTPADLQAKIPKEKLTMSDAEYENFLRRYTDDLADGDEAKHPKERLWVEATLLKDLKIEVNETSDEAAPATFQTEHFNVRGLAVDPALKHEDDLAEFVIGDTVIFDPKTVESKKLVEEGVIDKDSLRYIYVRDLHDYDQFFNDRYREELVFADHAGVIQADTAILVAANTSATKHEAYRNQEKALLTADLEGYKNQLASLDRLAGDLQAANANINSNLNRLFRGNLELASRIRGYQTRLAEQINQRLREQERGDTPAPTTPASSSAVSVP